jgi:hypothetical protein
VTSRAFISATSLAGSAEAFNLPLAVPSGHLSVQPVNVINSEKIVRYRCNDPLLQLRPTDRLAVGADDSAQVLDRELLLAIRTAIAVFGQDGIGTKAVAAFEPSASWISRPRIRSPAASYSNLMR